jgi:hypothetical protein
MITFNVIVLAFICYSITKCLTFLGFFVLHHCGSFLSFYCLYVVLLHRCVVWNAKAYYCNRLALAITYSSCSPIVQIKGLFIPLFYWALVPSLFPLMLLCCASVPWCSSCDLLQCITIQPSFYPIDLFCCIGSFHDLLLHIAFIFFYYSKLQLVMLFYSISKTSSCCAPLLCIIVVLDFHFYLVYYYVLLLCIIIVV